MNNILLDISCDLGDLFSPLTVVHGMCSQLLRNKKGIKTENKRRRLLIGVLILHETRGLIHRNPIMRVTGLVFE